MYTPVLFFIAGFLKHYLLYDAFQDEDTILQSERTGPVSHSIRIKHSIIEGVCHAGIGLIICTCIVQLSNPIWFPLVLCIIHIVKERI